MTHRLKILGLAAVAVLAMSAALATVTQAQFTASSYPKSATAESTPHGNHTVAMEHEVVLQCKAHFAVGPLSEASTTITVTPTYTECKTPSFSATVNMNGCDYTFHDTSANHQNKVTINCPTGKVITIVAGPCEMTIAAQGPLGNIATTTSGTHINLDIAATGIAYSVTKDGFLCPFTGTGAKTNAAYGQHTPVTITPTGGGSISVD